jgi:HK97 family phage major capsid protein
MKFDEELDEKIQKAADDVICRLAKSIDNKRLEGSGLKINKLLDLDTLMKKDASEMTTSEKVVGFFQALIQKDRIALKALSEGTSADGGYLVPDEFRAEVIRDIAEKNFMRGEVRVVPMRRDVMKIPTLESRPKVSWTEENATKSTTTAVFNEAVLTAKKMAAVLYASDELIEDSYDIDVVKLIIELFSEAIGEEEDRVIWRGNGTTQPTGVVVSRAAGNIATRTAVAGLTYDEIVNLTYDLPAKYHRNAKFWVHRNNIRELRKLKDNNNLYLWQPSQQAGEPPLLGGFPVVEVNDLPEDEIYFGDMKKAYWLGDKGLMAVKISQDTETAFTKDQTAIRVVERVAGNVVLTQAVRCLNGI